MKFEIFSQTSQVNSGPIPAYKFQLDHIVNNLPNSVDQIKITSTISTSDGYMILGNVRKPNVNGDFYINKLFIAHVDHHGEIPNSNYWVKLMGDNDNITEHTGHQIIKDYFGNYVVLGEYLDPYLYPGRLIWVFKINSAGNILISKQLDVAAIGVSYCASKGTEIIPLLDSNGPSGFAISGYILECTNNGSESPLIMRLDNNLNYVWKKRYNDSKDKFYSIAQLKGLGENLIVCGKSDASYGTMAEVDFQTGNLVSIPTISSTNNYYKINDVTSSNKVISTYDGGFLIGSSLRGSTGPVNSFMLHKFDQNRNPVWAVRYFIDGNDYVQLEDIQENENYEILLSSKNGLIITQIRKTSSLFPLQSEQYSTGNALTSFWRLSANQVDYQKLHFDHGSILGDGVAVATHFSSSTTVGGIPSNGERKEFRLIKTDKVLNTGGASCDSSIMVLVDYNCVWASSLQIIEELGIGGASSSSPFMPLWSCGEVLPIGTISNTSAPKVGANITYTIKSEEINSHHYCNESVYDAYLIEPYEDDYNSTVLLRKKLNQLTHVDEKTNALSVRTVDIAGKYILDSVEEISSIQVFDLRGKIVYENSNTLIDIRKHNRGIYIVKAISKSNEIYSIKLVKK